MRMSECGKQDFMINYVRLTPMKPTESQSFFAYVIDSLICFNPYMRLLGLSYVILLIPFNMGYILKYV